MRLCVVCLACAISIKSRPGQAPAIPHVACVHGNPHCAWPPVCDETLFAIVNLAAASCHVGLLRAGLIVVVAAVAEPRALGAPTS